MSRFHCFTLFTNVQIAQLLLQRGSLLTWAVLALGTALSSQLAIAQDARPVKSKHALMFAVTRYEHAEMNGARPLKFPEDDAKALGQLLERHDYEVEYLYGSQATREAILKKLDSLRTKGNAEGVCVVGFFGHGVEMNIPGPGGQAELHGCFCPYDAGVQPLLNADGQKEYREDGALKTEPAPNSLVKMSEVMEALGLAKAGSRVLIADCCREMPNRPRGGSLGLGASFNVKSLPRNTAVLFGCQPGEQSLEHDDWKHGAFTKSLLESFDQMTNAGIRVTSGTLADLVKQRVQQLTSNQQNPSPFLVDLIDLQFNVAKTAPMNKDMPAQPIGGMIVPNKRLLGGSMPGHIDFVNTKPGFLPAGWKAEGQVGIDHTNGIPGLGVTSMGTQDCRLTSNMVRLQGEFFLEYQLTDVTYHSLITRLSSQQGGASFEFSIESNRGTGWTVNCAGDVHTQVATQGQEDLWVRLENTANGVFLVTNGDPASRRRLDNPANAQFDSLQLEFPRKEPGMRIRMLRWGPLNKHQPLQTIAYRAPVLKPGNEPPKGWTVPVTPTTGKPYQLVSPPLQIGKNFGAEFEVTRKNIGYSHFTIVLRGHQADTTVPIDFSFSRGSLSIKLGNSVTRLDHTKISSDIVKIECQQGRLLVMYGAPQNVVSMNAADLEDFDQIQLDVHRQDGAFVLQKLPSVYLP